MAVAKLPGGGVGTRVGIVVWWAPHDRYRLLAPIACLGLTLAALLAILGLPPVDLHGPLHRLGMMDPFCGATRSVRYAARGQWAQSWRYNALGVPLVAGAVATVARAVVGALYGRWLTLSLSNRRRRHLLWLAALLVALLDVRQQMRAPLLLG